MILNTFSKIFFVFVILGTILTAVSIVDADEVTIYAQVTNVAPVASNVSINEGAGAINLSEANTTEVTVTTTITDDNNCGEISFVEVKFFRTDQTRDGEDAPNFRYTTEAVEVAETCFPDEEDLSAEYSASFEVEYYADPTDDGSPFEETDWTAEVTPLDQIEEGALGTDTIEINTLTALNVTDEVYFGEMELNQNSEDDYQTTVITNSGNSQIDVYVHGYGYEEGDEKALICDYGAIPLSYEKYSTSIPSVYDNGTAITSDSTFANVTVERKTDDEDPTGELHWGLGLPSSGVGGSCEGVVIFTAE